MAAGFIFPLLCTAALRVDLPAGPPVLLAVFTVVLRRVRRLERRDALASSRVLSGAGAAEPAWLAPLR